MERAAQDLGRHAPDGRAGDDRRGRGLRPVRASSAGSPSAGRASSPRPWPSPTVSGILEAAYFICLAEAYRRGDLSVVYPIARGTAPVLSVALGVTVLGERLAPAGVVGVRRPSWPGSSSSSGRGASLAVIRAHLARSRGAAGSSDATAGLARRRGRVRDPDRGDDRRLFGRRFRRRAPGADLALRRRRLPDLRRRARRVGPARRPAARTRGVPLGAPEVRRRGSARAPPGTISLGAYGLILIAYTLAPLTAIAPLRESSVVIASAWGAIRMGEAVDGATIGPGA